MLYTWVLILQLAGGTHIALPMKSKSLCEDKGIVTAAIWKERKIEVVGFHCKYVGAMV
jgi:hypothetical protein